MLIISPSILILLPASRKHRRWYALGNPAFYGVLPPFLKALGENVYLSDFS